MQKPTLQKVKQECDSCHGTGLYCGFCEPKGEAVVCCTCSGRGWHYHTYRPFTYRRRKNGIKTIKVSGGLLFIMGKSKESMTYREFEEKFPVEE